MDLGVLERSPEAGDAEAVDGLVAGYVARAERFGEHAVSVRSAGAALGEAMIGDWAGALVERTSRLAVGLDDAAGGCRQVVDVLAGYGTALRALRRKVLECREVVAAARAQAMAAQERYAVAALAAGGVPAWSWTDVPSFPAVPAAADELRVWSEAVDAVAVGVQAFERCCREREDLDRTTAERLAGVDVMTAYAPGTGVDAVVDVPLVQALAANASGSLDDAQRRLLVGWFVDLTDRLVEGPSDPASRELLAGFLEAWGEDPAMTGGLFAAVGGHGTLQLLAALSRTVTPGRAVDNRATADLAAQVRRGVASASTAWSVAEASEFAAGMVEEMGVGDGSVSLVGYLFADRENARMSKALTVATADLLDRIEQESGVLLDVGPLGYPLAEIGSRGAGDGVRDAAGPVFATLGTYPQAARDWFTGSAEEWPSGRAAVELGRIIYWFEVRDWSTLRSDGFAGIGAAWAGVNRPGFHGGSGVPSGELESDPWVQAVRAGEMAYATATNVADFSDPSMTSTWSRNAIAWYANLARGRLAHGTARVVLGPMTFTPLAVDIEDDGSRTRVLGCADGLATDPDESSDLERSQWPQAYSYLLELFDPAPSLADLLKLDSDDVIFAGPAATS
ncbi:hypothetical protein [Cellulomonas phragmiteti]|uniref:Uncharacterized protein n=1 Tax=Cellulomonas phragmiteti TaxID=478780 RepID=A0ABQ4DMQ0_9CELL|nr:hypothetical protein [Cellulomonas phragmiteti]GIG40636.1 hypothetical protein Cph01nite_23980 [Cellulomonas phragmiteti]